MERGGGGREVEAVGFMPEQKREEMKYREIEQNRNTKISLNILV